MRTWTRLVASCALLLGVAAVEAGPLGTLSHRTVLTFSRDVALPNIVLAAGTYTFELADPFASADIVVVRNREQTHVYYMALTNRIERPPSLPPDRSVTFGEARRGMPPPIAAWYPIGESRGYQFNYKTR
jgi:hypothetical protein